MIKTILVAVDDSHCARQALLEAADLARACHAYVIPVYVIDERDALVRMPFIDRDDMLRCLAVYGRGVLGDASALLEGRGIAHETVLATTPVRKGDVAQTLVEEALRTKADLLVMGTHGRSGLKRMVVGSVSREVIAQSVVPVLLVRSNDDQ